MSVCVFGTTVNRAKTDEPIEMPFEEAQLCGAPETTYIGATRPIRLSDPCAAAMRPCVKLLFDHLSKSFIRPVKTAKK